MFDFGINIFLIIFNNAFFGIGYCIKLYLFDILQLLLLQNRHLSGRAGL